MQETTVTLTRHYKNAETAYFMFQDHVESLAVWLADHGYDIDECFVHCHVKEQQFGWLSEGTTGYGVEQVITVTAGVELGNTKRRQQFRDYVSLIFPY